MLEELRAGEETPLSTANSDQDYFATQNSNSLGAVRSTENGKNKLHIQTYTAGEDASRLAAAAKELGLSQQRKRRSQVRARTSSFQTMLHTIVFMEEPPPLRNNKQNLCVTIAGVAGNILEWYDFAVFGYFGDIIGKVFFPPQEGNTATIESFAVFGGAFLFRPIGGILLGYLGDVYGRKKALTTSIFLMAFPTFAMGCLPSYERVGYISTILLIIIRLLQGMSVGGQLMSSLIFTLENVPHSKWGLYGSFVWATGNFGVLLGGLVGTAIRSSFTPEELMSYGWRIPFLSGVVVSLAGFYLRWSENQEDQEEEDTETENLIKRKEDNTPRSIPTGEEYSQNSKKKNLLFTVFDPKNLRSLVASAMVPMIWSSGFYLSFVWMAIYMESLCENPLPEAFLINSIALLIGVCLLFPVAGWLSDKFGRRTIMTIGAMSMVLLGPSLIHTIGTSGNPWISFGAQLFIGISLSFWGSPMGAWLTESFPPEARLTSVAIGYNTAHAIVGGSTPALATYLVDAVGPSSPGWIYVAVSIIGLIGLWIVAPPPTTEYDSQN